PCFPTVFEAVVNAVACQQLSLDVGIHLLSRLARRFGPAVPGPVTRYGFPAPARLAGADPAELRALGFSTAKARTIISVAGQAAAGALDLEALRDAGDDRAMGTLLGLPGIGRWSAEYVMLRGLARHHVLPGDDVGARNNLRRRFGLAEDAGYDAVAALSRRWQPYAGLVYFHLLLDALAARGYLEGAE
ncbi:MAG: DNA-3-methyladenine glycosylase family protein, partial [Trebonia sp.]